MLGLLTAIDQMRDTLTDVDAPTRQLNGVAEWREKIAEAVSIGSGHPYPAGMNINDDLRWTLRGWHRPDSVRFLYGRATHAAWRALCNTILAALDHQNGHAEELVIYWLNVQTTAQTDAIYKRAAKKAALAGNWCVAAREAQTHGQSLLALEDAIQVPVGRALAKVGRHEVAQDKHYHQRRMPR